MRTTIILLGLCFVGIAMILLATTKKGQEWMRKMDQ